MLIKRRDINVVYDYFSFFVMRFHARFITHVTFKLFVALATRLEQPDDSTLSGCRWIGPILFQHIALAHNDEVFLDNAYLVLVNINLISI